MSEIKLSKIVSFSSQDNNLKAENLLNGSKWISSKSEDTKEYVIIQLDNETEIRQIEIENESSASIEIQASKKSDETNFNIILPAVSFMSMSESKTKLNTNRLKVFTDQANLESSTLDVKWYQIKVICTQPFNTSLQFGISGIKLFSKSMLNDEMKEAAKINTGMFSLKQDLLHENDTTAKETKKNESFSMFQKYKSENKSTITDKQETKPVVKKPNLFKQPDDDDEEKNVLPIKTSSKTNPSSSSSSSNNKLIAKNQILKGVIFALSGFVNPERSELRDKGLKLGAKYRPDWTDDCTHLICAFSNTPKAQLVRTSGGKVVTKEWLFECEQDEKIIDWEEFKIEPKSDDDSDEDSDKPRKAAREAKKLIKKIKRKTQDSDEESEIENSDDQDFIADSSEEDDKIISEEEESFKTDSSDDSSSKRPKKRKVEKTKKSKKSKKSKKKSSSSSSSDDLSDLEEYKKKKEKEIIKKKPTANTKSNKENVFATKKKGIVYDDDDNNNDDEIEASSQKLKKDLSINSDKTEINSDSSDGLPSFWKQKQFYIYGSFDAKKRKLLERGIIAFAGEIQNYMNDKIDYVITDKEWNDEFKQSKKENNNLKIIKDSWITACFKKSRQEPYEKYEIKSNN